MVCPRRRTGHRWVFYGLRVMLPWAMGKRKLVRQFQQRHCRIRRLRSYAHLLEIAKTKIGTLTYDIENVGLSVWRLTFSDVTFTFSFTIPQCKRALKVHLNKNTCPVGCIPCPSPLTVSHSICHTCPSSMETTIWPRDHGHCTPLATHTPSHMPLTMPAPTRHAPPPLWTEMDWRRRV